MCLHVIFYQPSLMVVYLPEMPWMLLAEEKFGGLQPNFETVVGLQCQSWYCRKASSEKAFSDLAPLLLCHYYERWRKWYLSSTY
jgi:hypothetical protein